MDSCLSYRTVSALPRATTSLATAGIQLGTPFRVFLEHVCSRRKRKASGRAKLGLLIAERNVLLGGGCIKAASSQRGLLNFPSLPFPMTALVMPMPSAALPSRVSFDTKPVEEGFAFARISGKVHLVLCACALDYSRPSQVLTWNLQYLQRHAITHI